MSRPGKISRLPHAIRQELNRRLLDGETANNILPWLNDLPETRPILDAEFDGQPISEKNLSDWRHTGFSYWRTRQEVLDVVHALQDKEGLAHKDLAGPISDKLIRWISLQYTASVQAHLAASDDPSNQWSRLREVCADASRLRRSDIASERLNLDSKRLELEREWLDFEKANRKANTEKAFWAWTKRKDVQAKLSKGRKMELGISKSTLNRIEKELNLM